MFDLPPEPLSNLSPEIPDAPLPERFPDQGEPEISLSCEQQRTQENIRQILLDVACWVLE